MAFLMAQGVALVPAAAATGPACEYPADGASFALNLVPQDGVTAPTGHYVTTIRVGEAGEVRDVVVDTGSVGLVINHTGVEPALFNASKTSRQMLYTSSMDYLWGRLVKAPVSFVKPSASGVTVLGASTPVDITAVECVCHATKGGAGGPVPAVATVSGPAQCSKLNGLSTTASNENVTLDKCEAQKTTATAWMGVGFGRGPHGTGVTLADNPLVHIAGDQVHQGYVIAGDSVTVGLNAGTVQDYTFVQLAATSGAGLWDEAQAQPVLGGTNPMSLTPGALLVDVGIPFFILNTAQAAAVEKAGLTVKACKKVDGQYKTIVKPGTEITVNVLDPASGKPATSYRTMAADPCASSSTGVVAVVVAPKKPVPGQPMPPPAFNTGRSPIPYLNYAFDNQCGRVGFKAVSAK
ncbi:MULTISPECIES: hypothetical protein [Nitrospirillum]|uniref:hypothetical protein n=1 Tax=Nitrospirillum amazonense TaxID=28077 RepID=UPI001646297A|nr:hypothetical protein [Nitrospirillum amazonense]MEC4592551.1 hypothetical protein [Nitrospirillum amazonense]